MFVRLLHFLRSFLDHAPDPEEPPPFLGADAPPWAVRGLSTLLLTLFAVAVLGAVAIPLPETVTTEFVLVPLRGADPVRAPLDATVDQIHAVRGAPVEEGETLFVLRSEALTDRSSELATLEARRAGELESLRNQESLHASERQLAEDEAKRLRAQLQDLEDMVRLKGEELGLIRSTLKSFRKLRKQELVARTEYDRRRLEARRVEIEFEQLQSDQTNSKAALEQLHHESEVRETRHQETLRRLRQSVETHEIRIAALQEDLEHSSGNDRSIPAPCAGVVFELGVQAAGRYVRSGEVLAQLACTGEPLRAELRVAQDDVGLLEPGQRAKLLYDAFPYIRHGVRFGTLRWVSPASSPSEDQRAFRALLELDEQVVTVRGKPRALRPGMSGRARIVVGRRTLASYAFGPLRRLRESVRGAPLASAPTAGRP